MRHETHFSLDEYGNAGEAELDFRDPNTIWVRMPMENFDVVLRLERDELEQLIEALDDQSTFR